MTNYTDIINHLFFTHKWSLSELQISKFALFLDSIVENNSICNLTGFRSIHEIIFNLFLDSIEILKYDEIASLSTIIDIGTGAGIPAIPIKIINPDLKITLIESNKKKYGFLLNMIKKLNFENMTVHNERAEDLGNKIKLREHFDIAIAKAVAPLNILIELSLPFLKLNGLLIAFKGLKTSDEINKSRNALITIGGEIKKIIPYKINDDMQHHSFVIIKKIKKTLGVYPRRTGIPQKRPL